MQRNGITGLPIGLDAWPASPTSVPRDLHRGGAARRSPAAGLIPVACFGAARIRAPSRRSPPTARPPRWRPSAPATPTSPACRSRTRSTARCCRRWTAWPTGTPLQIYAELTLDVAFTIVVRARHRGCRSVRTVAAFPVAAAQVRRWLAEHLPAGRRRAGQLQRRRRPGRRRGPCRRGGQHRAGRPALRPGHAGRRASSTNPTRAPGSSWSAARARRRQRTGADRTSVVLRLDNVPGALVSAMTEFGDPRHRPDPHRIPAHPNRTGHLHLLPGLRRSHRRRRGRRGTQGAAPALCRCALSRFLADRVGRRRGTAPTRRGDRVAGPAARRTAS